MNKELEAPVIFNTEPFGYIFKKGELVHVIEAEPALARIKELEERLKLLETQNAEFKDYFQMQHVVRHRR